MILSRSLWAGVFFLFPFQRRWMKEKGIRRGFRGGMEVAIVAVGYIAGGFGDGVDVVVAATLFRRRERGGGSSVA